MKLLGSDIGGAIDIDVSVGNHTRTISVADVRGVSGTVITRPDATDVGPATVVSGTVTAAIWETDGARIRIESPASVSGARVHLEVPRGNAAALKGSITASGFERAVVSVEAGGRRTTAELAATDLTLRSGDADNTDGVDMTASAGTLRLHEIQTMIGDLLVRVGAVDMRGVSANLGDNQSVDVESINIPHVELSSARLGASLHGVSIEGARYRDGVLDFDRLNVESLTVTLELGAASTAERTGGAKAAVDLRVLDQLNGRVAVNLALDLALPVIGRRKATHHFRLGIESGTLDFEQLESGLAGLENAFIDFEVTDDALVLERDIPIVPGDNKPIVIWPLDEPGERELAARKRVRLRRLGRFELAGKKPRPVDDGAAKGPGALHSLVLDELEVELSMSAGQAAASPDAAAQTLEGWIRRAAFGSLQAAGGIRHVPGADPTPGAVELSASAIEVDLAEVPAGPAMLERAAVRIERVDGAKLAFSGARPTAVEASTSGWSVSGVRIFL